LIVEEGKPRTESRDKEREKGSVKLGEGIYILIKWVIWCKRMTKDDEI
jgi:hypothetical protein